MKENQGLPALVAAGCFRAVLTEEGWLTPSLFVFVIFQTSVFNYPVSRARNTTHGGNPAKRSGAANGGRKAQGLGGPFQVLPLPLPLPEPLPGDPLFSPALGTLASSTPHGMPEQPDCPPVPGPKYVVLFSCPQG